MKDTVCPIVKVQPLDPKQAILDKINDLEIKADVYSRTDYTTYNEIMEEIRDLDMKLLDMYNDENETFLQTKQA